MNGNKRSFHKFFSDAIINIILKYTNEEIDRQSHNYATNSSTMSKVNNEESFSAAKRDYHLNCKGIFNPINYAASLRAWMSCDRFAFLLNCIRFYDKNTREVRNQSNPFAPIPEKWELLILPTEILTHHHLTTDKQFLGFRLRCLFCSKPLEI